MPLANEQSMRPTLVEFLRARVAEDEAVLEPFQDHMDGGPTDTDMNRGYQVIDSECGTGEKIIAVDPWRLRFECQSKRQIMQHYSNAERVAQRKNGSPDRNVGMYMDILTNVMMEIALMYSSHPDYRNEWSTATPVGTGTS